jgi:GNAT superfamily N-acetyltransferase
MHIVPLDLADIETVRACYGVRNAATQEDDPFEQPVPMTVFRAGLTASWSGAPREVWLVPGEGPGSVAAWYRIELPDLANLNRAALELVVHPSLRRGGLGTALLRHAATRASASGRGVLEGKVQEGSAGEAFARRAGATFGLSVGRQLLDLETIPAGKIERLQERASEAAGGYSLTRWEGVTPEALLDQVAALYEAHDDAPRGADVKAHRWNAQRVRERSDDRLTRSGGRRFTVAAVDEDSNEMAALTEVILGLGAPGWAFQAITAVTRAHRGRRLALLVRASMLGWLAGAEPQAKRLVTWNAVSNKQVRALNEQLGYETWGRPFHSVELAAVSVAGD